MGTVIISYRGDDVPAVAEQLYSHLSQQVQAQVIKGVAGLITPGDDYVEAIQQGIGNSDALVLVIGANWLGDWANDADDYDTLALQAALQKNKKIVPVLVNGATIPPNLPASLETLKRRVGSPLHEANFEVDFANLKAVIQKFVSGTPAPVPAPTPPVMKMAEASRLVPNQSPQQPSYTPPVHQTPPPAPQYSAPPQPQYAQPAPYPQAPYGVGASPQAYVVHQTSNLHQVVGGLLALVGIAILIAFFALPWMKFSEGKIEDGLSDFFADSSYARANGFNNSSATRAFVQSESIRNLDGCTITGFAVATDSDGSDCPKNEATSNLDKPAITPIVQHSLWGVAIFGIIVIFMGISVYQSPSGINPMLLQNAIALGIILVVFPFIWQVLHQSMTKEYSESYYLDVAGVSNKSSLTSAVRNEVDFYIDSEAAISKSSYTPLYHAGLGVAVIAVAIFGLAIRGQAAPPAYPQAPYGTYR